MVERYEGKGLHLGDNGWTDWWVFTAEAQGWAWWGEEGFVSPAAAGPMISGRYYADIRQTIPASDQEMNSILAELSRNYSGDLGVRVALHELYKYINKYYDQIITALEEDGTAQKMQLGYRLQQIAAAVENKVTDLEFREEGGEPPLPVPPSSSTIPDL
ncbi:hypothetical protein DBR06_SOUSAS21910065, partial [Sousa chinensis]